MTPKEISDGLTVLRNQYAKQGEPYVLNDVQVANYIRELSPFTVDEFATAARAWIRSGKWFPAIPELLALIEGPALDLKDAAQLAWTAVERAIRQAGSYRGATFADGCIGETVQQVFGSWPVACGYDFDSPGWAIKRQTFLAVFPGIAQRSRGGLVTLAGLHRNADPMVVAHVDGLPAPAGKALTDGADGDRMPLSRDEASRVMQQLRARGIA